MKNTRVLIVQKYILNLNVVKSAKRENNDKNIIQIRGYNYVTISHQLPKIASYIISIYTTSQEKKTSMNYATFLEWIKNNNSDLLDYLFEEVSPLQWLSYKTLQKLAIKQNTGKLQNKILFNLQSNLQLLQMLESASFYYFDTDRSIGLSITEEEKNQSLSETAQIHYKTRPPGCKCNFCCYSCNKNKNGHKEKYPFE